MKIRSWLLLTILFLTTTLQSQPHPLAEAIKADKNIILKHGAHDTTDAAAQLEDAIRRGTSFEIDGNVVELDESYYFVNAHCEKCYKIEQIPFPHREHPEKLNPALLMPDIQRSRIFLKCDFKSTRSIEPFAYLAQVLPPEQKVGHAFVRELVVPGTNLHTKECCEDELLSFDNVKKARDLIGKDVPFIVSCSGITYENITQNLVDEFAKKAVGKAEYFNLNLPDHGNPPVQYAERIWMEYGMVPEIRISSKEDKEYWDDQEFPYIGLTDDPDLATKFTR